MSPHDLNELLAEIIPDQPRPLDPRLVLRSAQRRQARLRVSAATALVVFGGAAGAAGVALVNGRGSSSLGPVAHPSAEPSAASLGEQYPGALMDCDFLKATDVAAAVGLPSTPFRFTPITIARGFEAPLQQCLYESHPGRDVSVDVYVGGRKAYDNLVRDLGKSQAELGPATSVAGIGDAAATLPGGYAVGLIGQHNVVVQIASGYPNPSAALDTLKLAIRGLRNR